MTQRERLRGALLGEEVDQIPFCGYPGMVAPGELERKLREEGYGIFYRVGLVRTESRNTVRTSTTYWQEGRYLVRNTIKTPAGEVYETLRTGGGYGSSLRCEFFIKSPEDYRVMEFIIKDEAYSPNYDAFLQIEKNIGEDGIVVGTLPYTPMQHMLILLMGPERFAIDYYERQDEFFSLYETLCRRHEEMYEIVANSPAEFVIYGDNITAEMIGVERFKKYVVPCYDRLADVLHSKGKKLGSHMDGNLRLLKDAVAASKLDFIEAYNPPPDGDLRINEARRAWKGKSIGINFTSSVHLRVPAEIEAHTIELLKEAYPGTGFIVGLTENIPYPQWRTSLPIINRLLREKGRLPLKL